MFDTRICWGPSCANETPAGMLPPLCSEACRASWKASLDYLAPAPPSAVDVDHPAPVVHHARVELRIEPDVSRYQEALARIAEGMRCMAPVMAEAARRWAEAVEEINRAWRALGEPDKTPTDPQARALFLRQNRNTGPAKPQPRAPRQLDTTARRRTR